MNACRMVNTCLRHQMPEAYGFEPVPDVALPPHLRYGAGETYEVGVAINEEPSGDPNALPLDYMP